jgi:mannose-6-phosphate isomerase
VTALRLSPNLVKRGYRGGAAIARFRDLPGGDEIGPEDWVGSTTSVAGQPGLGISCVEGRPLPDILAASAAEFFPAAHLARYGPQPELLVKLLDAGERLMVHCHPDREFAARHLGVRHGKTEAWLIAETRGHDPVVWLGFKNDVGLDTLAGWVDCQDAAAMLESLNRVRVRPGDVLFVPGGVPHAIGEGLLIVELQEPSDLSVLLEWEGFSVDGANEGHLDLGFDVALQAVDRSRRDVTQLSACRRLSEEAAPYFGLELVEPGSAGVRLPARFSIIVVLEGEGVLREANGTEHETRRGDALLVPYAAGECRLGGHVLAAVCLPPAM